MIEIGVYIKGKLEDAMVCSVTRLMEQNRCILGIKTKVEESDAGDEYLTRKLKKGESYAVLSVSGTALQHKLVREHLLRSDKAKRTECELSTAEFLKMVNIEMIAECDKQCSSIKKLADGFGISDANLYEGDAVHPKELNFYLDGDIDDYYNRVVSEHKEAILSKFGLADKQDVSKEEKEKFLSSCWINTYMVFQEGKEPVLSTEIFNYDYNPDCWYVSNELLRTDSESFQKITDKLNRYCINDFGGKFIKSYHAEPLLESNGGICVLENLECDYDFGSEKKKSKENGKEKTK